MSEHVAASLVGMTQQAIKEKLQPLTLGLLEAINYGDHLSIKKIAFDLQRVVAAL